MQNSEIKITFCLEGKEVELNEISKCLDVIPSRIRTPNDWPDAIKNPKTELPDELKPRYTWEFEIGYEKCKLVQCKFEKMIEVLKGKETAIIELKEKFALSVGFVVSIHAQHDQCNMPEIFLTQDIISFTAAIGADIGFDMYLD